MKSRLAHLAAVGKDQEQFKKPVIILFFKKKETKVSITNTTTSVQPKQSSQWVKRVIPGEVNT